MRKTRCIVSMIIIFTCLSLSGCMKSWTVTFGSINDVEGWEFFPYGSESTKSINDEGLMLDGFGAIAPKLFTGNCTMTIVFELLSGDSMQIKDIGFFFLGYPGSQQLGLLLNNVGDETDEYCAFVDNTSWDPLVGQVPGIRHIGSNTIKLKKMPGEMLITLNGEVVFSRSYSNYSEEYVVPAISAWVQSGIGQVLVKSIEISYDGEMVNI